MIKFILFGLLNIGLLNIFLPSFGFALGGSSGGGGGDRTNIDTGAAWFIGADRSISICTVASQDFIWNKNEIETSIIESFKIWEDYVSERGVERDRNSYPDTSHPLLPSAYRMSFKVNFLSACDGSENLTIYLGESSPEVALARSKYINPIGMAERTNFDKLDGFAKGFIWIDKPELNSWEKPTTENLKLRAFGVLLHELGHVFGCNHVAGTIMDENISLYATPNGDFRRKMRSIDYNRQLIPCMTCWAEYPGERSSPTASGVSPEVFEIFTGRIPIGITKIKLIVKSYPQLTFIVSDERGATEIPVQLATNLQWIQTSGTSVFYVDRAATNDSGFSETTYRRTGGHVGILKGRIRNPKVNPQENVENKWLFLTILFNDDAILRATILKEEGELELFKSAPKPSTR
jgi:hypothetical protein